MTDDTVPAVEVRGLTKVYDDHVLAVDDIDFAVDPGTFCVIIGPSGCGKTTTLHSLVGTVDVTDGQVLIDGEDVTDVPTYERDIGLVFQDFQLFPHLDVEENIRYGLKRIGSEDSGRVDRTIELMGLGDVRDREPGSLSAGQRQRVALARSLVLQPEVLLLDEPLGDLDYKLQKRMERELMRIHREVETTFVYVTHDQRQAMRLGDQLIVMNDGRIEQDGTVDAVYTRPATAFVAAFVGDSNIFSGELRGVDEGVGTVATPFGSFTATTENLESPPETLVGETVSFVVRPHLLSVGSEAKNQLTTAVLDVIERPGTGTKVLLEATDGSATKELQAVTWDQSDLSPGDDAAAGWAARDAILLERTSVVDDVDLRTDILGE